MAWIELRRRRYVVIDRVEGVKAKGPSYDTRADAESFLELVALAGWPAALHFVNQEPVVDVLAEDDTTSRATRERAVAAGAVAAGAVAAGAVADPALRHRRHRAHHQWTHGRPSRDPRHRRGLHGRLGRLVRPR